jgi:hypothetical protein
LRNHKLGLLLETRGGKGKLLVCAIALRNRQGKPEARPFCHALLRYAASDAFAPQVELNEELLEKLLPGNAP